jgi:hypothetical protein
MRKVFHDPGAAGNEPSNAPLAGKRFTARATKRQRWLVPSADPFATKDALVAGPLPCTACGKRVPSRSQRAGRILCVNCREGGYLAGAHWRPVPVTAEPIETKAPTPTRLTGRLARLAARRPEPEVDKRTKPDDSRHARRLNRGPRGRTGRRLAPLKPATDGRRRPYSAAPLAKKRAQASQAAERRANAPERPASFPERQYTAWFLTQIEGLSLAEAGIRMGGISKVAVKHLVDKAIRRGVNASADNVPVE